MVANSTRSMRSFWLDILVRGCARLIHFEINSHFTLRKMKGIRRSRRLRPHAAVVIHREDGCRTRRSLLCKLRVGDPLSLESIQLSVIRCGTGQPDLKFYFNSISKQVERVESQILISAKPARDIRFADIQTLRDVGSTNLVDSHLASQLQGDIKSSNSTKHSRALFDFFAELFVALLHDLSSIICTGAFGIKNGLMAFSQYFLTCSGVFWSFL